MRPTVSEVEIEPVKARGGLVAFASFVLDGYLYCGSVGIMTRPDGSYRLCFPTRKLGTGEVKVFHPINKEAGEAITMAVLKKFEDVAKDSYGRYGSHQSS